MAVTIGGDDVIRSLLWTGVRVTSVGVVSPGMFPILGIGRRDCVGGSIGRSDWLDRLSWWEWLTSRPMGARSAGVVFPGGVRIVYIRSVSPGSSSLDTAPVGGCYSAVLSVSGLLDVTYSSGKLCYLRLWQQIVMGGRAGITFYVELVIPWDAPEAVVDLHSDILIDLDIVPDVIGLSDRRSEAAVSRILQGRDVRSVRVLVPEARGLERNFHDVTIVDMGDSPEVSVSRDDLSMLHRQWPATVLRHMVWLQQDLDTMRAEARKRFRNAKLGKCSECHKWIKCDIYRHVATYHLDLAQLWRCPVSWCTVWQGTPQDCMDHVRGGT